MLIAVGLVFVVLVGSSSSLALRFTSRGFEYTDYLHKRSVIGVWKRVVLKKK